MAPLLLLVLYFSAFGLLHRPVVSIDALFNEPGQYILAPQSLGQFGFDLGTNCSIQYQPKGASNAFSLHEGYSGVRGCQLLLDRNGTLGLFPEGEFERRKFEPKATRSGYYVLAGSKGHTMVYGPAIFCTPKELCRSGHLPHAASPFTAARRLRDGVDSGLGGVVISGPGRFRPGLIMSYGNYSLILEDQCNLSIVDVTKGTSTWATNTNTTLLKVPADDCWMNLSPTGELSLVAMRKDGKAERLYGTGAITGVHADPGHVYALRYDGRLMIYPPKSWGPLVKEEAE